MAALRESLRPAARALKSSGERPALCRGGQRRRWASTQTATGSAQHHDLEQSSSLDSSAQTPPSDAVRDFDPVASSRNRQTQLPRSRYQYRPPKYYRGPLHPIQPPRPSDPASREFIPGPFSQSRLEQTYDSTIAHDILALTYTHYPPGFRPPTRGPRLQEWIGDSPYFKNRPPKGPRGGTALRLLKQARTFRNVPRLTGIVVHSMASEANDDSAHLHVTSLVLQSITNARVAVHRQRSSVAQWGGKAGRYVSCTATLRGEDMYDFLGRTVDIVLPRIKEWPGVSGGSGDSSGNISFGLTPAAVAAYPEIEVNYDMYPPKMIPGCHVTLQTSATNDKDARILLSTLGIPFHGKLVD